MRPVAFVAVVLLADMVETYETMRSTGLGRSSQRFQAEVVAARDAAVQRLGWFLAVFS